MAVETYAIPPFPSRAEQHQPILFPDQLGVLRGSIPWNSSRIFCKFASITRRYGMEEVVPEAAQATDKGGVTP